MALRTRTSGYQAKQLQVHINGMKFQTVRSGLGPAVATQDTTTPVYGSVDAIVARTHTSGPVTLQLVEGPTSHLLNLAVSEIRSVNPPGPVVGRKYPAVSDLIACVDVMEERMTTYAPGSEFWANWKASVGAPQGDPGGEMTRTVEGPADVSKAIYQEGHWLGRRVQLVSQSDGWRGSWSSPVCVVDSENSLYAIFLEIQKGTGYDRVVAQIEPDAANVVPSGTGGGVLIPHADVISAGWVGVSGTDLHAYAVFIQDEDTVQSWDLRYGTGL